MTHAERKTHLPPLPAAGAAPAPCLLGEVPLVSLHEQSRALGLSCCLKPGVSPVAQSLVRATRTRRSGVFVSIYK